MQNQMGLRDARHRVYHALDDKLFTRTARAADELHTGPDAHRLRAHRGTWALVVFFHFPRAYERAGGGKSSILKLVHAESLVVRNAEDPRIAFWIAIRWVTQTTLTCQPSRVLLSIHSVVQVEESLVGAAAIGLQFDAKASA